MSADGYPIRWRARLRLLRVRLRFLRLTLLCKALPWMRWMPPWRSRKRLAIRRYIEQEAKWLIEPHVTDQEQRRRWEGINALGEKYPDLEKYAGKIRAKLDELGLMEEGMLPDPMSVELVYGVLKADELRDPDDIGGGT